MLSTLQEIYSVRLKALKTNKTKMVAKANNVGMGIFL